MSKVYVVGIGPGAYEQMTIQAIRILNACEVIVGYTVYIDLLKEHFPEKKYVTTPMKQEVKRCEMAFEEASQGKATAMVCSGDAGVYGMAGLMYEIGEKYPNVSIEIVAGVTAALSGGALLGAPLGHDFAVISLSDLLTPWDKIEQRLKKAAEADLAICLYNPSSKKRANYLNKACETMLKCKSKDTICGVVKNIGRPDEAMTVHTLFELQTLKVDMFSTVFIGNSQTKVLRGHMVTPRGYRYE